MSGAPLSSRQAASGEPPFRRERKQLKIVIFSGGRGSSVLSQELLRDSRISLTLAINGYDDGLSTGEVRRFLGEALGPSDFRKNANRLAGLLHTVPNELLELLEARLPETAGPDEGCEILGLLQGRACPNESPIARKVQDLVAKLSKKAAFQLAGAILPIEAEVLRSGREFKFSDCSIGNLVFAGCFLAENRSFNRAIDRYSALVGLPQGTIENVTDGGNAFLVAIDDQGKVIANEADIVDTNRRNRIAELFLVSCRPSEEETARLNAAGPEAARAHFMACSVEPEPNRELLAKLRDADIIVYAPGPQHSSLFPSYLTPGVGAAIAHNLRAFKILITNLQGDADMAESSAVEIIERAVYYLREKGRLSLPPPCLVTHYLINDPQHSEDRDVYLPLGLVDTIEDPRLVRIGNYEDGVTGRHDATKLLQPFVRSFLRDRRLRVGIMLLGSNSINKISQTLIEMVRSDFGDLDVDATVFYESPDSLPADFLTRLPFQVSNIWGRSTPPANPWDRFDSKAFDYMVLFESSGMYKGEDVILLVAQLMAGQLDAVWGSRRLSLADIRHAYRLLHHDAPVRGAVSYIGSHVLSLACLFLYGRYVNDTLSGVRAVRTSILRNHRIDPKHSNANFRMLSVLLRLQAEVIETPVRYFPISPQKVKRTSVREGVTALWTLVRQRFTRCHPPVEREDETDPLVEKLLPITTKLRKSSVAR
jgi:2-phospho-L-lactate transferase/gluconeogenesis factor (CofD/UPF0052 family)